MSELWPLFAPSTHSRRATIIRLLSINKQHKYTCMCIPKLHTHIHTHPTRTSRVPHSLCKYCPTLAVLRLFHSALEYVYTHAQCSFTNTNTPSPGALSREHKRALPPFACSSDDKRAHNILIMCLDISLTHASARKLQTVYGTNLPPCLPSECKV